MKTITIQSAEIKEIIISPLSGMLTTFYNLKDDLGNTVYVKSVSVKITDLPSSAQTSIDNFKQKLLDKIIIIENL